MTTRYVLSYTCTKLMHLLVVNILSLTVYKKQFVELFKSKTDMENECILYTIYYSENLK